MSVVQQAAVLEVVIDLATRTDLDDVVRLLAHQFSDHDIHLETNRLRLAVETMLLDARLGRILVARHAGKIVGVAAMSYIWTLEHVGKSCWLDELYVEPDLRERSVGAKLLHAAYVRAHADECVAMDLEVEATHARAANLYVREGFSPHQRARFVRMLP